MAEARAKNPGVGVVAITVFAAVLMALPLSVDAQRLGQRAGGASQPSEGGSSPQSRSEPSDSGNDAPRQAPAPRSTQREQGQDRPSLSRRPAAAPAKAPSAKPSGDTPAAAPTDAVAGGRDEQSSPPRARGDGPVTGRAVRGGHARPPSSGGYPIYPGGYYPWGYGGFGFGAYYDGYWGPYDSGYGGYPSADGYTGAIRLKVKPRNAAVYVDGFFVGLVDEFDGIFQRLHIEPGAYTIEIRADGYEPHTFDVRVVPDRTTTYAAELIPLR